MTKFITSIGLRNLIASERPNVKHKTIMRSVNRVFTVEDLTLAPLGANVVLGNTLAPNESAAPLAAATNIYR